MGPGAEQALSPQQQRCRVCVCVHTACARRSQEADSELLASRAAEAAGRPLPPADYTGKNSVRSPLWPVRCPLSSWFGEGSGPERGVEGGAATHGIGPELLLVEVASGHHLLAEGHHVRWVSQAPVLVGPELASAAPSGLDLVHQEGTAVLPRKGEKREINTRRRQPARTCEPSPCSQAVQSETRQLCWGRV